MTDLILIILFIASPLAGIWIVEKMDSFIRRNVVEYTDTNEEADMSERTKNVDKGIHCKR